MADDLSNGQDEVQRLKNLVKTLEFQNNALRSKTYGRISPASSTRSGSTSPGNGSGNLSSSYSLQTNSQNSDDSSRYTLEDVELLDLSSDCSLDDETSWLFISPSKYYKKTSPLELKRWLRQDLENPTPDLLSSRRLLTDKLKDIERGRRSAEAVTSSTPYRASDSSGCLPQIDLNGYSDDSFGAPVSQRNGDSPIVGSSLLSVSTDPSPVNSATFKRQKKRLILAPNDHFSGENDVPDTKLSPNEEQCHPNGLTTDGGTSSLSIKVIPPSPASHGTDTAAGIDGGDDSTSVRTRRNLTRTIDPGAMVAARVLQGIEGGDDAVGNLREAFGAATDTKSKRESLDIQTLARLQELSLRESFNTVKRAPHKDPGAAGTGVPPLAFTDLESSTGSSASGGSISNHSSTSPVSSLATAQDQPKSLASPAIKSGLSPRTVQPPKSSGLQKPRTSLPGPAKPRSSSPTASSSLPVPKSGLRPPSSMR